MSLPNLIKKPVVAAILGATAIAAPVGVLYMAGATRAVATTQAAPAPASAAPAVANPAVVGLPDFSSMVQRYGAAVVNIAVVTKASPAMNGQGDDDDDDNGGTATSTPSGRTARSRRSSAASRRPSSSPRAARAQASSCAATG